MGPPMRKCHALKPMQSSAGCKSCATAPSPAQQTPGAGGQACAERCWRCAEALHSAAASAASYAARRLATLSLPQPADASRAAPSTCARFKGLDKSNA